MRRTVPVLVAAALAMAVGFAACGRGEPSAATKARGRTTSTGAASAAASGGSATVTRVVDGDTIVVRLASRSERVRLIGIDTPESVKPGTPVQCFGKEASARTKQLLPAGTRVRLERDAEARDRYGRLLAYVYRDDGLFVNLALARDGFAVPYTFPPNVAHADEFVQAAAAARDASRGLWSACGDDIPKHPSSPLPSPP